MANTQGWRVQPCAPYTGALALSLFRYLRWKRKVGVDLATHPQRGLVPSTTIVEQY